MSGRLRTHAVDSTLLALPVVAVLGAFALPVDVRRELVFHGATPTIVTAYTAVFVHYRVAHLLTDLVGYVLLSSVAYWLCAAAGRRSLFRAAVVTYVSVLPFALSALNLAMLPEATEVGFSGVVMAYLGLVAVGLGAYVTDRDVEPVCFLAGILAILVVGVPQSWVRVLLVVGVVALATAYVGARWNQIAWARCRERLLDARAGWAAVAGGTLLLIYPYAAFPSALAVDGSVVNLYQHLLGYALGFLPVYVVHRLVNKPRSVAVFLADERRGGE